MIFPTRTGWAVPGPIAAAATAAAGRYGR
jgi:hypothetical protein